MKAIVPINTSLVSQYNYNNSPNSSLNQLVVNPQNTPPNLSSFDPETKIDDGFSQFCSLPPINWVRKNIHKFFDSNFGNKFILFLSSQLAFTNEVAGVLDNSIPFFKGIYPHEGKAKWPIVKAGIDLAALSGIVLASVSKYREETHEFMVEARTVFQRKIDAIHEWYLKNIENKSNKEIIELHHIKVNLIKEAERVFHQENKLSQLKGIIAGFLQGVNYSVFSFLITSTVISRMTKLAQNIFRVPKGQSNILVNLFGSGILGIGSLELGVRVFEKLIPYIVRFFIKPVSENNQTNQI
jgi:hypothetical protein